MKYLDNSITYSCMQQNTFLSILRHVFRDRWYIPHREVPCAHRHNNSGSAKSHPLSLW